MTIEQHRVRGAVEGQQASPSTARGLGTFLVGLVIAGTLFVFAILYPQLPANASSTDLTTQLRAVSFQIAPQGWAFFTISPRDPKVLAWAETSDGVWADAMRAPHSEPHNAFGFSRDSRAQGVEIGVLLEQTQSAVWTECTSEHIEQCLEDAPEGTSASNPGPSTTLCGDVALVQQEPLPWAWVGSTTAMPAQVLRLEVSC